MALKSLLVCADENATEILRRILKELDIDAEYRAESLAALKELGETRYDAIILECEDEKAASEILRKTRSSKLNGTTLVVALVNGENNVRQLFGTGANFVLYKPISPERAKTSLQAARGLMRRERRRNIRVPVYAPAAIAYANVDNENATLIDLSEEGTAIQCERKLPASGRVYFQFSLPGHKEMVRLSGEVVWQDSTGRVGIRFTGIPQASGRLLKMWLEHNLFRQAEIAPRSYSGPSTEKRVSKNLVAEDASDGLLRLRASPGNRRGQSRHACRLGAEVYRLGIPVPHRCNLTDISTGGCYVEIPSPFANETPVEILVRTRDLKIRTRGVVQSVHPGFGMGVKFNPRKAEERDQIQQLISLLASQQALEPFAP